MAERMPVAPWPPRPAWRGAGYTAPPRPAEGVVTWNINTSCNYRCSYCTQRFLDDRGRWARDTEAFLDGFARLPGVWEVKMSGGEPFLHPSLVPLAAGLRQSGHRLGIVTNLSAPLPRLEAFLIAAAGAIKVFSASLHLEYVNTPDALDEFVHKAHFVQERLETGTFNVTCVATRTNLPHLETLDQFFSQRGIRFKVQPEKQDRQVINYTPVEQALIERLGGHNRLGELTFDFEGRPCWAGSRSFTLDDRGDAWRCYPARRYRAQYLGNFLDGSFRLARGPSPCLYSYCNCTVPIERNMMPRGKSPGATDATHQVQDLS